MTDLTPNLSQLVTSRHGPSIPSQKALRTTTETADEFLKEAYRIVSNHHTTHHTHNHTANNPQNSHITSLLKYLQSIRHAYLSTKSPQRRTQETPHPSLTDPERDEIDTSTALLLRDLAASITNLSTAETLRQETETTIIRKRYGHSAAGALLFHWAGGADAQAGKSTEQVTAEESAKGLVTVRESVLWFLRRGLEGAASVQRSMVEKRIERVREKEKSVLYKNKSSGARAVESERNFTGSVSVLPTPEATHLSEDDTARIEAQLSAEQLQLFAEENDSMLRHYEDTLGKVQ